MGLFFYRFGWKWLLFGLTCRLLGVGETRSIMVGLAGVFCSSLYFSLFGMDGWMNGVWFGLIHVLDAIKMEWEWEWLGA